MNALCRGLSSLVACPSRRQCKGRLNFVAMFLGGLLAAPASHAGDKIFTHVYQVDTLPKGAFEVEQWMTNRQQKSQGKYALTQLRTELEYGVSDRWTVAVYANAYGVTAQSNNSMASRNNYAVSGDGDEVSGGGPITAGPYVPHADFLPLTSSRFHKAEFESLSLESIYQIMSPYKDALGLAAYVELTKGSKTQELEFKLLAQKNLLDDDLIFAGNLALEFEREKWSGVGVEKETKLKLSAGASYRLTQGWRAGVELRNERSWEGGYGFKSQQRDYSAWYAGPTLHYNAGRYFFTLSYQQQLPAATAYSVIARDELVDRRVYKANERHQLRLIAGYAF